MLLYHVSFKKIRNNILYPRVPDKRSKNEDAHSKRICFADSIEHCLTAMPYGGIALDRLLLIADKTDIDPLLHVYTVDTDQIDHDNFVDTRLLSCFVKDAGITHEMWIINQKVKCHHQIIRVLDADIYKEKDSFNYPLYMVNSIQSEPVKRLNKLAFKNVFHDAVKEKIDLRYLLYFVDSDTEKMTLTYKEDKEA